MVSLVASGNAEALSIFVSVKIRITAGEVHLGTKEITDHLYPCFFHTLYCYVFPLLASSVSSLDLIQNCGNSLGSPVCKWDSTWVHFVAYWLNGSSFLPQVQFDSCCRVEDERTDAGVISSRTSSILDCGALHGTVIQRHEGQALHCKLKWTTTT